MCTGRCGARHGARTRATRWHRLRERVLPFLSDQSGGFARRKQQFPDEGADGAAPSSGAIQNSQS